MKPRISSLFLFIILLITVLLFAVSCGKDVSENKTNISENNNPKWIIAIQKTLTAIEESN